MAERRAIGLEYIKIGAIEGDGSMSTSLAALGVTYQDTAELVQDDPDTTEIYSEENTDPEEEMVEVGAKKMNWSIMNYDPDEMVKVLGGTATGTEPNKTWNAPTTAVAIEKSIEFKTTNGMITQIPRAKITAKLNWQMRKKGVALIDIAATVLTPADGSAPINIAKPA